MSDLQHASAAQGLAWLLSPLATATFIDSHWERRTLHLSRGSEHVSALGLNQAWLSELFARRRLRASDIRLVQSGDRSAVPQRPETEEIDVDTLKGCVSKGATIVVNDVDRFCPRLAALRANLEDALTHPITINLYATPVTGRGFAAHFDHHDVFVLQLEGRKHWRIFGPPLELPLPTVPPSSAGAAQREVAMQAELTPGDLLYLVRGTVHEAYASVEPSIHVTIGVHCLRWLDLMKEAVHAWALADLEARRALPPGPTQAEAGKALFAHASERFVDQASWTDARARLVAQFLSRNPGAPEDLLGAPAAPLSDTSSLSFRRRLGGCLVELKDGLHFRFSGGQLRVESRDLLLWRFLQSTQSFCLRDAPGPRDRAISLIQQLLQIGCLVLAAEET